MAKTGALRTRVDKETEQAFRQAAKALHKKSMSVLLLELVEQFLAEQNMLPDQDQMKDNQTVRGRVIGTRINDDEARALAEILQEEKRSTSAFLLNLVRARLTKSSRFSQSELNELREANRQLLAIGRNLNQYIRAMHEDASPQKPLSGAYVDALKARVDDQARRISALISKNKSRDIDEN